jgi:hypothetical protein
MINSLRMSANPVFGIWYTLVLKKKGSTRHQMLRQVKGF